MLQVVGHSVTATVLALAETAELDLRMMIGYRGVLGVSNPVPLLIDRVEKDEGVAVIIEGFEIVPVSDLASEVLVVASQDGWENIA